VARPSFDRESENMTQRAKKTDLEAAQWAVRLQLRPLTAEEQAELDQWIQADSRHRGALLRARAAWMDLDRLAALSANRQPEALVGPSGSRLEPSRRWFIAAGVTAAMCAGGAGAWWFSRRGEVYVSGVGQIRRVTLSDGSHMVLNTDSMAKVRFNEVEREIELESGEGLFQVVKDPERPFIVRAGSVSVQAVGTVFAVRALDDRVDVTVTEGVVEVVDRSGSGSPLVRRVSTNEHATVMQARRIEIQHLTRDEAERRIAWRQGLVNFAGESLSDAVAEMNRHNQRRIIIDDPTLAARPIVGLFRADDPEGCATAVAVALGAQSVEKNGTIHIRPRPTP
jgi:transmembrane sensor